MNATWSVCGATQPPGTSPQTEVPSPENRSSDCGWRTCPTGSVPRRPQNTARVPVLIRVLQCQEPAKSPASAYPENATSVCTPEERSPCNRKRARSTGRCQRGKRSTKRSSPLLRPAPARPSHQPALAKARAGLALATGPPATAHTLAGALLSNAAHGQETATNRPVNDRNSTTSPPGLRLEGIDTDQFAPPRPTGTLCKQEPRPTLTAPGLPANSSALQ